MSIVVNIYYSGENGSARKFAKEMISSGTVDAIRNEAGNIRYDYFFPLGDEETVLLIDSWENQESIDFHHQTPMMNKIAELRDKYNLHMKVERYQSEDTIPDKDQKYIRRCMLIARTFKSSLLQRWSAHLWQNEMTKVRKFHIMFCIAIY